MKHPRIVLGIGLLLVTSIGCGVFTFKCAFPSICRAAQSGNRQAVVSCLTNGDNIEARIYWHQDARLRNATALALACRYGHADVCEVLLLAGADLKAVDAYKRNALMIAVESDQVEVCRVLLRHGADPEEICEYAGGLTPLQFAIDNHKSSIIELFEKTNIRKD